MRHFNLTLIMVLLISSCASQQKIVKLPTTYISPSSHFVSNELLEHAGANFFNDDESFDRLLAAKRMGIKWIRLTPSKWKSALYPNERGTFLVGKKDEYRGLIEEDLKTLLKVLDWAQSLDLKVMLTFLTVPGRVFAQHNQGAQDNRIWQSEIYQEQAVQFIRDVALYVGHHPALMALNPINEPSPEKSEPRLLDWYQGDYQAWGKKIENTPQDLNRLYGRMVLNIRRVRKTLPIVLDAGFHAHPWAFKILKPFKDPGVWYAFHWYEPFLYSQKDSSYSYPGQVPTGENLEAANALFWDKTTLATFLKPVIDWQHQHNIDGAQIVVGEFGLNRLIKGAPQYLGDLRALFLEYGFMHAFYHFREPQFPRMDYELGAQEKLGPYWQALEEGVTPNYERLRKPEMLEALGLSVMKLKKPLRGFNSWNTFGPDINETIIKEIIDTMKAKGLLEKGYNTIIVDGGWRQEKLSPLGLLQSDDKRFPDMAALASYAHAQGFKFGLHIPVGTYDCANKTRGTVGFEKANAEQLQAWGIDLVKLDQCILDKSEDWPEDILKSTYKAWNQHLADKNIEIMASASRFWPWYPRLAHYGRTSLDLRPKIFGGARFDEPFVGEFISVVQAARQNSQVYLKADTNYRNDPDMLVVENGMSFKEDRSHLAMWAMMGAPLVLGNDPRSMSDELLKLLKNDQFLRIQADPTEQGRLVIDDGELLVWRKRLEDGATAILAVSLKKTGKLKRDLTLQELDVLKPNDLRSVFNGTIPADRKKLSIELEAHDCELLLLR